MTALRRRRLSELPWHPILLLLVVVLSFWLDTAVSPYAVVRSLAIGIGAALALTVVAGLLTRSMQLGGLIVSGLIVALWSKHLVQFGGALVERMDPLVAVAWAILVIAAIGVAIRLWARRWRLPTRSGATAVLNQAGALLLVATLAIGVVNGRLAAAVPDLTQGAELASWSGTSSAPAEPDVPDIYAILLDGYPRADVLRYAFGIDNTPFVSELEARGFVVASNSHSDYLWTHVSVPSALNMAFIEDIPAMEQVAQGRAPRQPTLRRTVAENQAFRTAREHGYATVAVGAGFEEVAARQADVYVDGGQLNEFEINLLVSTYLGDAVAAVAPDFASAQQRARILHNLEALADIAGTQHSSPWFVFDHVPAPHQPTVFGADGEPVTVPISDSYFADSPLERGESIPGFRARYAAQLPYLNQQVLAAIDRLLAASDRPPVILLFADHGSASQVDWNTTQPADADPARLLERTGTLFAALTPERASVFPDDISPVNMFRFLFDAYLDTTFGAAAIPEGGGHVVPIDASVLDE